MEEYFNKLNSYSDKVGIYDLNSDYKVFEDTSIQMIYYHNNYKKPSDDIKSILVRNISTELNKDNLPKNLKFLSITNYNFPLIDLPDSLEILLIDNEYNNSIKLPPNLKAFRVNELHIIGRSDGNIHIESIFNQPLEFPDSLEIIVLGGKYNQPIDKFPTNLKYLHFGNHFKHPILNLPSGIIEVKLPYKYNNNISILNSIDNKENNIYFSINGCYPDYLPDAITELTIEYANKLGKLPSNLKKLSLKTLNLNELDIKNNSTEKLKEVNIQMCNISKVSFSDNIERLSLDGEVKEYMNLPSKLKKLNIVYKEFKKLSNIIPDTIEEFYINSDRYDYGIITNLPSSIKKLYMNSFDISHIKNNFPLYLEEIKLVNCINANKLDFLPGNLKCYQILNDYDHDINIDNLPYTLEVLGFSYRIKTKFDNLPSSIKKINIYKYCVSYDEIEFNKIKEIKQEILSYLPDVKFELCYM